MDDMVSKVILMVDGRRTIKITQSAGKYIVKGRQDDIERYQKKIDLAKRAVGVQFSEEGCKN